MKKAVEKWQVLYTHCLYCLIGGTIETGRMIPAKAARHPATKGSATLVQYSASEQRPLGGVDWLMRGRFWLSFANAMTADGQCDEELVFSSQTISALAAAGSRVLPSWKQ